MADLGQQYEKSFGECVKDLVGGVNYFKIFWIFSLPVCFLVFSWLRIHNIYHYKGLDPYTAASVSDVDSVNIIYHGSGPGTGAVYVGDQRVAKCVTLSKLF